MTDSEAMLVPCCPVVPAAAVSAEQASSLITSCARKQAEKRRAESNGPVLDQQGPKRSKAEDAVAVQDQGRSPHEDASGSDVSIDDQEKMQQQAQLQQLPAPQHPVMRAACSTLGHMLAPFVGWMPTSGHQQVHQLDHQHFVVVQQQIQPQNPAAALVSASANEDGVVWSDETVAYSEEGLNNSLSTSSAPTVSQPSTAGTAGCSVACVHPHHLLQQQYPEHEQAALHVQQAACSAEGTAVTSAGNVAEDTDDVDYDDDDFCPFTFISSLGAVEQYVPPGRQPLLPRQTRACKQKTLVLDLDETLVHSTLDAGYGVGADFSFPVLFNGCEHMVHVRMRPHMQSFLERVAEMFEVVVFTASQKVYAEKLLNILDPHRNLIRHRIYRDSCVVVEGNYLKDLSVLGRDLCRCAIVDNSPQAFGFQLSNGIPIESWYDDPNDNELPALLPFLEMLATADVPDVRPAIQEKFNLKAKVAEANQRLAAAAAAAAAATVQQQCMQEQHFHQQRQQQQQQQQQQQHAAVLMAQVATAAAGVLQSQSLPSMSMQMMMQQPQQAQEQAA